MRLLFTSLLLISPLLLSAQTNYREWIKSPEAYFATNEERDAWQRVSSQAEADRFVAEFWRKRGEAFRKEVHGRIDRADDLFRLAGTRGSLTAKGRVWMILGSPSREQLGRSNTIEASLPGSLPGQLQNNSVERGAIATARWIYRKDRLPPEMAVPELVVSFQTNTARGHEVIENPGLVEPYLKRVVEYYATRRSLGGPATPSTPTAASSTEDPLWKAPETLASVFFHGDGYIAAHGKPFYAVSFYVPRSATAFADLQSVLLVGLANNERGEPAASVRQLLPLLAYGSSGDRYVDRSFPLEPGSYSASFALFTPEGTTLLANRRLTFTLPAATDTYMSLLMPTAQIEAGEKQLPFDPFTFVATKYAVKGDHRFSVNDRIGFFTVISNPAGEPNPSLSMAMTISRDGKVLHRTTPAPASLTQTGPHTWLIGPLFEPGSFPPGQYRIEMQVTNTARSEAPAKSYMAGTDFRVE